LGTLPAGSFVLEKSRFALYSARGADLAARTFAAGFFATVDFVDEVLALARFGAAFEARVAALFAALFAVRFVPDRGVARLVAMRAEVARSVPAIAARGASR
jgi:hypothetical protein